MGIVKIDISDHFPIFLITSAQFFKNIQNKATIRKRDINERSKHYFMETLNEVNRKNLYSLTDTLHKICENAGFHLPVFSRGDTGEYRSVKTRILAYFMQ